MPFNCTLIIMINQLIFQSIENARRHFLECTSCLYHGNYNTQLNYDFFKHHANNKT